MVLARKPIILLVVVALTFGMLMSMPLSASAVVGLVTIEQSNSLDEIQANIQGTLNGMSAGDALTVEGSKTGANGTIHLSIPADVTLIWKAVLKDRIYIQLLGSGTFEVADGAELIGENNDVILAENGNVHVVVSGGLVENTTAGKDGIHSGPAGITVTGGMVKSIAGNSFNNATLYNSDAGTTRISGGEIELSGSAGIAVYNSDGETIVSGGTVTADGELDYALYTYNGRIKVTGGHVSATGAGGQAIFVHSSGAAAYLVGTCDGGLMIGDAGWGIIVEVSTLAIPKAWNGTSTGITIKTTNNWNPADGVQTVTWDTTGDEPVIVFDLIGNEIVRSIEWGYLTGAPGITGPTSMTVTEGYTAFSTDPFTLSGDPTPTVVISSVAGITWNATTQQLDIAAGLPVGTYTVTLTASNGEGADAVWTFTLVVEPAGGPDKPVVPPTGDAVSFAGVFSIVCVSLVSLGAGVVVGRRYR